jgi:predicted nucleic acid-binding protein
MDTEIVLVDSTLIIDFLRKKRKSKAILFHLLNELPCSISIITEFEVRVGINTEFQQNEYDALAKDFEVFVIDKSCIDMAIEIFLDLKKHNALIGFEDLLIGATAVSRSLHLATLNRKHFERIPGLQLLDLSKYKQ